MKLNAPKVVTFWFSLLLFFVGLIAYLVVIPFISTYAVWFIVVGFVLLALGCLVKGLYV